MNTNKLSIKQALNKALIKVKVSRGEIDRFKANLLKLVDRINQDEDEEFGKKEVADFLKNTYYHPQYLIKNKKQLDLVIHNGPDVSSSIGVIIEAKKPSNKAEMMKVENLNSKAFQQLVYYFLQQRISAQNSNIKHLIATNIYEWFIFEASEFEKYFAQNPELVTQFQDFTEGKLGRKTTELFYEEIAKPAISKIAKSIIFTHFDLRDYEEIVREHEPEKEKKLISLWKIFSPTHLLQLGLGNDSNTLDQGFYNELLYLIGLTEVKVGSKKLIQRPQAGERHRGSLIENTISKLANLDQIENLTEFGKNESEQRLNIGLELVITWINRILFLKLLEGQIVSYNKRNKDQSWDFLNIEKIKNYQELNRLFFQVLACKVKERSRELNRIFGHVPYLNSSLFESTELEEKTIFISDLTNEKIAVFSGTVLKEHTDKKRIGSLNALEYLLEFLNAYDFSSEGIEEIQEHQKTLINAAVLGLIFEKINGYQDGSFFTPSFITMYMCRETIRRAVVQKFNQVKGWECEKVADLYNKIEDLNEANQIINSLKICDPAVGSGHFLVSALNELIVIKGELKILLDATGKRLKEYKFEIVNDELMISEDGEAFEYRPKSEEGYRVQETLFREKKILIEKCLFGVDINPNSVKICCLRLWIELLKNAYYKPETKYQELETLPNLEINIKCGNSLVSRFPLDADLRPVLRKSKLTIEDYQAAVKSYRYATKREEKVRLIELIKTIKNSLANAISQNHPKRVELRQKSGELYNLVNQLYIVTPTPSEQKQREKLQAKLESEISQLEADIEELESGQIYQKALEWRFEFPEVLSDEGEFLGFDIIIGNPPYINAKELVEKQPLLREYLSHQSHYTTLYQKWDIYIAFIEKSLHLINHGMGALIIPYPYLNQTYAQRSKEFLIKANTLWEIVDLSATKVFDEAIVSNCIIFYEKQKQKSYQIQVAQFRDAQIIKSHHLNSEEILNNNGVIDLEQRQVLSLGKGKFKRLGDLCFLSKGMVLNADEKKAKGQFVKDDLIREKRSRVYCQPYIEGKNIDRYQIQKIRFLEWGTKRVPSLISRPTFPELYERPKIVINKIGKIKATYDESQLFCDQTIRIAVLWHDLADVENKSINNSVSKFSDYSRTELAQFSRRMSLKFILGILNSNLGNYLLDQIRGVGNIDINPEYLKNLPIPDLTKAKQQPLINLVDRVLSVKQSEPDADTISLEQEIDRLVYQLYGLTPDQIAIVET